MSERTVLVTGSSGLLGHAILGRLAGQCRTIGLDSVLAVDPVDGVTEVQADLRDADGVLDALRAHQVTQVVHAGAISHPLLMADQPAGVLAINVQGTQHVLEAARLCGVERLVLVSSAAVYGAANADTVLDEASPLTPDTIYGATKAASEMLVAGYAAAFGLATVVLRPVSIYGPRRRTDMIANYLVANALDGLPSRVRGSQALDLVHVDDVARAACLALDTRRGVGRSYQIASGAPTTHAEIAALVRRLVPGSQIEVEAGASQHGAEGRYRTEAAAHDLGFVVEWDLERGLRQLIDVLGARPDLRLAAREARALVAWQV